eukprot:2719307-Rhodomonas_salina.3
MGQDEEQIGPLVRQWSERSQAAGVTDFVRGKIREIEDEFGIKNALKGRCQPLVLDETLTAMAI